MSDVSTVTPHTPVMDPAPVGERDVLADWLFRFDIRDRIDGMPQPRRDIPDDERDLWHDRADSCIASLRAKGFVIVRAGGEKAAFWRERLPQMLADIDALCADDPDLIYAIFPPRLRAELRAVLKGGE